MFGPLSKTLQMESIPAYSCAGAGQIWSNDLHMADCTEMLHIILILFLLDYEVSSWESFDVFEKLGDFVEMYASIGDNVPQFFIRVTILKQKLMLVLQIKYFSQCIQRMHALSWDCAATALDFVSDS